jgi:hypothetical protein
MFQNILIDLLTFCLGAGLLVRGILEDPKEGAVMASIGAALVTLGALKYQWMRMMPPKDESQAEPHPTVSAKPPATQTPRPTATQEQRPTATQEARPAATQEPLPPARPLPKPGARMVTIPIILMAAGAAWGKINLRTQQMEKEIESIEHDVDDLDSRVDELEYAELDIGHWSYPRQSQRDNYDTGTYGIEEAASEAATEIK